MSQRSNILAAVTNPLGFLVLSLLLMEGFVNVLLVTAPLDNRLPIIWITILSIPGFAGLVTLVAWFRPEALSGYRPLDESNGRQLAADLYMSLDDYMRALEPAARLEAWTVARAAVTDSAPAKSPYARFCKGFSDQLSGTAKLPITPRPHGPG
jgi:hypothetical protein